MRNKSEISERLKYWRGVLAELRKAYLALIQGGVKSYILDDRQLTKLDLLPLKKQIDETEAIIDELEDELAGGRRRRAFAVVPMDW